MSSLRILSHKGIILTKLTLFWLELLKGIVPNHLITGNFKDFPKEVQHLVIKDRAMIVKRLKPLPVEMIVRGYLSGSGWKEYQKNQSVCGEKLPAGLKIRQTAGSYFHAFHKSRVWSACCPFIL